MPQRHTKIMSEAGYETVYTVFDYWDGPRRGLADWGGKPHLYQCVFDEAADDWSNVFLLRAVDARVFKMAMEDWQVWLRWEHAFHEGHTTIETHPALPAERQRHEELKAELDKSLTLDPATAEVKAKTEFRARNDNVLRRPGMLKPLLVRWTPTTELEKSD